MRTITRYIYDAFAGVSCDVHGAGWLFVESVLEEHGKLRRERQQDKLRRLEELKELELRGTCQSPENNF